MTTSHSALRFSALTALLVVMLVGLLIPAASAEVVYDNTFNEFIDTSGHSTELNNPAAFHVPFYSMQATDITKLKNMFYITITAPYEIKSSDGNSIPEGTHPFTATIADRTFNGTYYYTKNTNILGVVTSSRITYFFDNWDVNGLQGSYTISFSPFISLRPNSQNPINLEGDSLLYINQVSSYRPAGYDIYHTSGIIWQNRLVVTEVPLNDYKIDIIRFINDEYNPSTIKIFDVSGDITVESSLLDDQSFWLRKSDANKIELTSSQTTYTIPLGTGESEPEEPTVLRTGTVTMTDHNGTTISGFSVKAVNAYTGVEYDVSTETDVAIITLPMDRTISWRNPQTGQYEDVPVGYYYFYGYKSGYKMTNEEGIRISVLPEQYQGSYQLCDIIVTSDTGYLTGKHQFQIRSRVDNRILQTGAISAQSATTGEWYNTTVVNGLATLILPYDTSNPISQYAGNYYVYATSPGYQDSEYGTQITVMPITQSEINTILLTPIGGIPEAGNVTLRIQVISETGQGIPNAEILIDGIDGAGWEVWDTYTTSLTGYLEVSVYENSTYDIIVFAQGYFDSSQRIEVFTEDPPLLNFMLYPTGAPTLTPTPQPTGWITPSPTTQPTGGIPDEDDDSEGFLMEAIRGISKAFGVGFGTAKIIFGMLLALAIGFATAKQLRGGAAEFGLGLLGGTMLGVLIGLIPIWVIVVLLLIVGMYVGYRYVGGGNNG